MCLYIVDNVSTWRIIYFRYVDTEIHIDNSPNLEFKFHYLKNLKLFSLRVKELFEPILFLQ